MNIPKNVNMSYNFEFFWNQAAANITMESGVFVEVERRYETPTTNAIPVSPSSPSLTYYQSINTVTGYSTPFVPYIYNPRLIWIGFKIEKRTFETLTDVKRAIKLKEFM